MRRFLTAGVCLLIASIALPLSAGSATPPISAPTGVIHLRPVDSNGALLSGYTVTKKFSRGGCNAGSEATNNAYRCFAGQKGSRLDRVVDPCWVESGKNFVACLIEPWSFDVVQIHVTKGFDNAGRSTKPGTTPWGLQTSDGSQCLLVQGASTDINGKRVNYFCEHSSTVLYGNVKRGGTWTIRQATEHGSGFTKNGRAKLSKAWFGKPSLKG